MTSPRVESGTGKCAVCDTESRGMKFTRYKGKRAVDDIALCSFPARSTNISVPLALLHVRSPVSNRPLDQLQIKGKKNQSSRKGKRE